MSLYVGCNVVGRVVRVASAGAMAAGATPPASDIEPTLTMMASETQGIAGPTDVTLVARPDGVTLIAPPFEGSLGSSATDARFGSRSDMTWPDWPRLANLCGEPSSLGVPLMNANCWPRMYDSGHGLPFSSLIYSKSERVFCAGATRPSATISVATLGTISTSRGIRDFAKFCATM